jgi:hypothetical protein
MQFLDITFEVCLHPIHAGGCVLRKLVERFLQKLGADMVEKRGEPLLLPFACDFPYAFQRL